jgi:hypothetical protein
MTIPNYVDCKKKEIEHCDYYFHKDCPESCGFALDIKGNGIENICDADQIKSNGRK